MTLLFRNRLEKPVFYVASLQGCSEDASPTCWMRALSGERPLGAPGGGDGDGRWRVLDFCSAHKGWLAGRAFPADLWAEMARARRLEGGLEPPPQAWGGGGSRLSSWRSTGRRVTGRNPGPCGRSLRFKRMVPSRWTWGLKFHSTLKHSWRARISVLISNILTAVWAPGRGDHWVIFRWRVVAAVFVFCFVVFAE